MEDCKSLAADCVVISCCCQCLILQILVLVLVELPRKLIRKARDFARKKIMERKRRAKTVMIDAAARELVGIKCKINNNNNGDDDLAKKNEFGGGERLGCCVFDEVERVMGELYGRGEFGFGSFWCNGKDQEDFFLPTACCLVNGDQYDMVEMVGSFNCK